MLNIIRSNRVESLMEALVSTLRQTCSDPICPEFIGVQNRGMKRWLSLEIAKYFNIFANVTFMFPRDMIRHFFVSTGVLEQTQPELSKDILELMILDVLPDLLHNEVFYPISHYIGEDHDGIRLFHVASHMARLFDDYLVYRPETILEWQESSLTDPINSSDTKQYAWQALLWKTVSGGKSFLNIADLQKQFFDRLKTGNVKTTSLPSRVFLFGISSLPPLFVEIFHQMGQWMDVFFFLLSPSREFWGDTITQKQLAVVSAKIESTEEVLLHLDLGNPLLSSMGKSVKGFFDHLEELNYHEPVSDLWHDPIEGAGISSMLKQVQSDILNLIHRGPIQDYPELPKDPLDNSIRIHACHSPMREIQVLKDQLLDLFSLHKDLAPHDIIVMMPDIEAYAPYIEAEFSVENPLPFSISDRKRTTESRTVDVFVQLINTLDSRMALTQVMDILLNDAVRSKFEIDSEEAQVIFTLAESAGIFWGRDGVHRQKEGMAGWNENSWEFGLQRLFLGYAMPEESTSLFQNVLPCESFEGSGAEVLGKMAAFCDTLFALSHQAETPKGLISWCDFFLTVLSLMLDKTMDNEDDHWFVEKTLRSLKTSVIEISTKGDYSFRAARELVLERLDQEKSWNRFLSGGITFCNLMPMRSIPFKVVVLMGMNDQAFPRRLVTENFNLMAQFPRPGDRNIRNEDRYLFLEALLSAREYLIITYTGMRITDNAVIPPSPVVDELIDVLESAYRDFNAADCIIMHPLQPFDDRYFCRDQDTGSRLFSFSNHFCGIADSIAISNKDSKRAEKKEEEARYFSGMSSRETPVLNPVVTLDELIWFFRMPLEYWMKKGLGIRFPEPAVDTKDREPFDLDFLEHFFFGQFLVDQGLKGFDSDTLLPLLRASGRLPHGNKGLVVFQEIETAAAGLCKRFLEHVPSGNQGHHFADFNLDGVRITGTIDNLFPEGRHACTFSRITSKQILALWINHIFLNCARPDKIALRSMVTGRALVGSGEVTVGFPPLEETAVSILKHLLSLYQTGTLSPLMFFPETSWSFAEAVNTSGGILTPEVFQKAAKKASFKWKDSFRGIGEGYNRYAEVYFKDQGLFDDYEKLENSGFARHAIDIFSPVLKVMEKVNAAS